jgi:secreted Zn-dependent insulinase-like peptidase
MFNDFFDENIHSTLLFMITIDQFDGLSLCQQYAETFNQTNVDLHYLPISNLLTDNKDICHKHFKNILKMLKLKAAKIIISSSHFDESNLTNVDKYYGVKYDHVEIDIDTFKQQKLLSFNFSIPPINPYIPKGQEYNMQIIDTISSSDPMYTRIASNNNNIYYVKRGNTYRTYTISGVLFISLDALQKSDPIKTLALLIYTQYINKQIQSDLYLMSLAKISISITPGKDSIMISLTGYDSDIGIDHIFEKIITYYLKDNNLPIDESIYYDIYNDIKTEMQNYQYIDPYAQVISEFKSMINKYCPTNEQMYELLKHFSPKIMNNKNNKINYKTFKKYCIDMMKQGFITGIFGGSINMKKVNRIINFIDEMIKQSMETKNIIDISESKLSAKYIKYNKNPNNKETAIGYGLYIGNIRESVNDDLWKIQKPLYMILEGYISGRFSASVRTDKQIGYVALSSVVNVNKNYNSDMYLLFILQSTRTDLEQIVADYVDNEMMKDILMVNQNDFEIMKQGIISQMTEQPLNIIDDCNKKLSELLNTFEDIRDIENIDVRFMRNKLIIDAVKKIDLNMFVSFVKQLIANPRAIVLISPEDKSKNNH